jgi:hypothetical protein
MKNYKSYQVIYYCIVGNDSEIVIASNKLEAKRKVLTKKPHVTIIDCINVSK